jgi:hypothetical protein
MRVIASSSDCSAFAREREPPADEVLHRRLAHERCEALGERGARHRDLVRQLVHGPGAGGIAMHQRERATHAAVAHPGEPTAPLGRQRCHVAAKRLDERELGELGKHRLCTGPRIDRLAHGSAQQVAQQPRRRSARNPQHRRKRVEQRAAHARAASEVAADEARGRASATVAQRGDVASFGRGGGHHLLGGHGFQPQVARHYLQRILREEDQVSGLGDGGLAVRERQQDPPLHHEVEEHDALGTRQPVLHVHQAVLRVHAPRRGEFGVQVDGAFQVYRLQDVRKRIHGDSVNNGGALVKTGRCGLPILTPFQQSSSKGNRHHVGAQASPSCIRPRRP